MMMRMIFIIIIIVMMMDAFLFYPHSAVLQVSKRPLTTIGA